MEAQFVPAVGNRCLWIPWTTTFARKQCRNLDFWTPKVWPSIQRCRYRNAFKFLETILRCDDQGTSLCVTR